MGKISHHRIRKTGFKLIGLFVLFVVALGQPTADAQTLQRWPPGVSRSALQGRNPLSEPIRIWSAGGGAISYSIYSSNSAPWLLVWPTNGTCSTATNTHLWIFNGTNLALGLNWTTSVVNGGAAGTQTVWVGVYVYTEEMAQFLMYTSEPSEPITNYSSPAGEPLGMSSPYAYCLTNGLVRLYYNANGIMSAISTNYGTNFALEAGTRVLAGYDPTIVPIDHNRLRMYFKRSSLNEVGWPIDQIYSAVSSNGLDWSEEGLRFTPASGGTYQGTNYTSYASVPEAVILSNGQVRLYYVSNKSSVVADVGGGGIGSSLSADGLIFEDEAGARVDITGFVDPAITRLTNGYYWLVVANPYNPQSEKGEAANPLPNGLYSYISEDGLQFYDRQPLIVAEPGEDTPISRATDPAILSLGGDVYRVYFADPYGDQAVRSVLVTVQVVQVESGTNTIALAADFDGDAKADPAIYKTNGTWKIKLSGSGYSLLTLTGFLGGSGYTALAADFDGDGKADPAGIDKSSPKIWYIRPSASDYATASLTFSEGDPDRPVAADFDGDGLADPAGYESATGKWIVKLSGSGYATVTTTLATDGDSFPIAADFDGDGLADPAGYENATGRWIVKLSGSGYATVTTTLVGDGEIFPIAADFDGDGRVDPTIYQEATGTWQVKFSSSGYAVVAIPTFLGGSGYTAFVADFDGDAKADPAVVQTSTGNWKIRLSSDNYGRVDLSDFLGE